MSDPKLWRGVVLNFWQSACWKNLCNKSPEVPWTCNKGKGKLLTELQLRRPRGRRTMPASIKALEELLARDWPTTPASAYELVISCKSRRNLNIFASKRNLPRAAEEKPS